MDGSIFAFRISQLHTCISYLIGIKYSVFLSSERQIIECSVCGGGACLYPALNTIGYCSLGIIYRQARKIADEVRRVKLHTNSLQYQLFFTSVTSCMPRDRVNMYCTCSCYMILSLFDQRGQTGKYGQTTTDGLLRALSETKWVAQKRKNG